MKKIFLETVTLLGVDCVNIERLKIAMDICEENFKFAAVKILSSLPSTLENVIAIEPLNSLDNYSRFIINDLHKYLDTDHVLIVQHDGFILNPQAWNNDFLNYDYIGAPWLVSNWSVDNFNFPIELMGQYVVGNGGFSLRTKKLCSLTAKLSQENKFNNYSPEDVAIGVYHRELLESYGVNIAPVTLAQQFSFEAEGPKNYAWTNQFGFHGLKWTNISNWSNRHPEYKIDNPAAVEAERLKYL